MVEFELLDSSVEAVFYSSDLSVDLDSSDYGASDVLDSSEVLVSSLGVLDLASSVLAVLLSSAGLASVLSVVAGSSPVWTNRTPMFFLNLR